MADVPPEQGDPTEAVPAADPTEATDAADPTEAVPAADSSSRRTWLIGGGAVVAVVALVAAALVLTSGGDEEEPVAAPKPSTTTTTVAPILAPLTGLPYPSGVDPTRPATVVKIDDSPAALGKQSGINAADVVLVEQVEGGYVRLAAVFQSQDATVGPVRSARSTDVDLTANLNGPLFSYSGANGGVLAQLRSANLVDVGVSAQPQLYESRNNTVLRFFTTTAQLYSVAPAESSAPAALFTYRATGQPVSSTAQSLTSVTVDYGTKVTYEPRVNADLSVTWDRAQGGVAHVDDQGVRVSPENVVILGVQYVDSGFVDASGGRSPEAQTIGSGEAWVLTAGKLVHGTWSRPTPEAPYALTDDLGAPIALTPGRTWTELAPAGRVTPSVVAPTPPS